MAGIGQSPKDPSTRARRNKDHIPTTVLPFMRADQPPLPEVGPGWPEATVTWWAMWGESAQAELMTATDWSFLLDTALLHAKFWSGELTWGPELRLRVAKFGATLEDRARLRITFAAADEADGGPAEKPKTADVRELYPDLKLAE